MRTALIGGQIYDHLLCLTCGTTNVFACVCSTKSEKYAAIRLEQHEQKPRRLLSLDRLSQRFTNTVTDITKNLSKAIQKRNILRQASLRRDSTVVLCPNRIRIFQSFIQQMRVWKRKHAVISSRKIIIIQLERVWVNYSKNLLKLIFTILWRRWVSNLLCKIYISLGCLWFLDGYGCFSVA